MDREFFESLGRQGLAFDDVLLTTGHSRLEPSQIPLETRFSRNVPLKIPIVSAAMDTLTRHKMAIAVASHGGIGAIDRKLGPEDQASEVARVKHYLHGVIDRPITVLAGETIEEILRRRAAKGYSFDTFPVIDQDGRLVGLMTETDFSFTGDKNRTAREEMTPLNELVVGCPGISPHDAWERMRLGGKKKVLPLVDGDGRLVGMYVFSDVERIISGDAQTYNVDGRGRLRVAAAIGVLDDAYKRVPLLIQKGVDVVIIDVAHADTAHVEETTRSLKQEYPDLDVVVGNISNGESARRLVNWGADGIKVGQGPGSICTTRSVTGAGGLQLTAIAKCALAIEGEGVPICGDGGFESSGHITIAIGAGADSVMLGRLLAGTDECPGEVVIRDGIPCKLYRGMGSPSSMQESQAARERYRQSNVAPSKTVPEGVDGWVPYQGPVGKVLDSLIGGLQGGMGMVGAESIFDLQAKARFERLTSAGQQESRPHGLLAIRSTPNYPGGVS